MKVCFVISPIGEDGSEIRKEADRVFNYIIRPATRRFGKELSVKRADHLSSPGSITHQVINMLRDSELVIADLTGWNPNVMYELAVRHFVNKPTILILSTKESRMPFDLQNERTVRYDTTDLETGTRSAEALEGHIEHCLSEGESAFWSPSYLSELVKARLERESPSSTESMELAVSALNVEMAQASEKISSLLQSFEERFKQGGADLAERVARDAGSLDTLITQRLAELDHTVKNYGGDIIERFGERTQGISSAMRDYLDNFDTRVTTKAAEVTSSLDQQLVRFKNLLDGGTQQFNDLLRSRVAEIAKTLANGGKAVEAALDKRINEVNAIINVEAVGVQQKAKQLPAVDATFTDVPAGHSTLQSRPTSKSNGSDERDPSAGPDRRPPHRGARNDESIDAILSSFQGRRRSRGSSYVKAGVFAVVWITGGLLFGWLYLPQLQASLGPTGLTVPVLSLLAIIFLAPCVFFFAVAYIAIRSQEMRLIGQAMGQVAIRLTEPETVARESVVSLGQAVRREVAAMGDGIERALSRAAELETLVANEVSALEHAYNDNEVRIRALLQDLGGQRDTLVGQAGQIRDAINSVHLDLSHDVSQISELVVGRVEEASRRITHTLAERGEHITRALGHAGDTMIQALGERGGDLLDRLESTSAETSRAITTTGDKMTERLREATQTLTKIQESQPTSTGPRK
jgi:hypothetical protein